MPVKSSREHGIVDERYRSNYVSADLQAKAWLLGYELDCSIYPEGITFMIWDPRKLRFVTRNGYWEYTTPEAALQALIDSL